MSKKERKLNLGYLNTKISSVRSRLKNLFSEFGDKHPRVLILGLDGAGKTSMLYKARLTNAMFATVPPHGMNIETMTPRFGATITLWDMKGSKLKRHLWANYFRHTEGIVYVVDSTDIERLDEALFELNGLLESGDLRGVPVVVAANKQDMDGAMEVSEVSLGLELDTVQDRDWRIHGVSGNSGKGVSAVFKDIVNLIKAFRQEKKLANNSLVDKSTMEKEKIFDICEKSLLPPSTTPDDDDAGDYPSLFQNIKTKERTSDEESVVVSNTPDSSGSGSDISVDRESDGTDGREGNAENIDGSQSLSESITDQTEEAADEDATDGEPTEISAEAMPDNEDKFSDFQIMPDIPFNICSAETEHMSDVNIFQSVNAQSKV